MIHVEEVEYKRHEFSLTRKIYVDLPEELKVIEVDQIIQEANSPYDDEFKVLSIGEEVLCEDIHTKIKRHFFLDSVRISEKEIKRQKRAKILNKKAEAKRKRQEKEKKRTERAYQKSIREHDKKNRKLKRKKTKEVLLKFV